MDNIGIKEKKAVEDWRAREGQRMEKDKQHKN